MKQSYFFKCIAIVFAVALSTNLSLAQYTVTGAVTDEATGEVLIGVNVFDAASGSGASTNVDGEYTITLPSGETTLRFTSIGYITRNIEVSGSDGETVTLNVDMEADVANLEELVVTGLASTVKRSNLGNAVTTLDAEELTGDVNPQTLDAAFQGKIPGVNIRAQSGAPGGGINVQLRGISTLGAGTSQPLYIIDGVYLNNDAIANGRFLVTGANSTAEDNASNRLADINPEDIESVEVLKGPSAAAIYGQRANSGVVIIKTKRGRAGKTQVSFSQDVGFNDALNLLGVAEWDENKIEIFQSLLGSSDAIASEQALFRQARDNGRLIDYEEEIYGENGLVSQTSISVSGGNEKTSFFVSGTTKSEDGIIENTGFDRNSLRLNLDHRINDRVRVSSRSNYIKTDNQRGFTGNQNGTGGSVGYALAFIPTYAQLFPDAQGNFPNNPYFSDNPVSIRDNATNDQVVQRFVQGASLNADLYTGKAGRVGLTVDAGLDYLTFNSLVLFPNFLQSQQSNANPGDAVRTTEDNFNTNIQAIVNYETEVETGEGLLQLNTQLGISRFDQDQNRNLVRGQGLVAEQRNVTPATTESIITQSVVDVVDFSWFGQQEINWEDKIIATLGGRFDRSSLNADQEEYYFYPKASVAVNIPNFEFWSSNLFNQLKLRTAYGETGGLPRFGQTFRSLNGGNIGGLLGNFAAARDIDPNLQPESAKEIEFGADLSLLDNRVGIEATYYKKTVEDLILDEQVPTSSGFSVRATNAAELENTGFELALNLSPIRSQNLNWMSTILFWTNDSEITDLSISGFTTGGFGTSLGSFLIQEGFSPTTIVGNPAVSDPSLFTVYGDAQPDFEMSFGNEFNIYKNFDLSFLFHWKKGGDNINLSLLLTDLGGTSFDWNDNIENTDLANGVFPKGADRLINGGTGAYIEDASYLKLRELSLYYTLPTTVIRNAFGNSVRNIRFGVSGNNLFLWTPYDSYDPETSVFGTQAINNAVEVTPFPTSRQVMFHFNIDF